MPLVADTCVFVLFFCAASSRLLWARGIILFLSLQSRPAKDVLGEIGKISVQIPQQVADVFDGCGKGVLTALVVEK